MKSSRFHDLGLDTLDVFQGHPVISLTVNQLLYIYIYIVWNIYTDIIDVRNFSGLGKSLESTLCVMPG